MLDLLADVVGFAFGFFIWAFLLRLLFQVVRTDFRNPLVQAVVKLTNPLVRPLRRVLPPLGRLDTASLVSLIVIGAAAVALQSWLRGYGMPSGLGLLLRTLVSLASQTLEFYLFAVILWAVLSWVVTDGYNPMSRVLGDLLGPLLRPIRRVLPTLEGLDLSPMVLCVILYVLMRVLERIAPQLLATIG